ncbi:Dirigent protein [Arabidopsis suecica]|uniref:Dirigent protein n=1 Tax=Arabidopsis suecica TaxID=45249 RepID=A0A8T2H075_ARASU|nr:Dirigent protein [Arabidopsis suecica]
MAGYKVLVFLILALAITFVSAGRLLDEEEDIGLVPLPTTSPGPLPTVGLGPFPSANSGPATGIASGTGPASGGSGPLTTNTGPGPLPTTASSALPVASSGPLPTIGSGPLPTTGSGPLLGASSGILPNAGSGPLPTVGSGAAATGLGAGAGSVIGGSVPDNTLVFFMHDILGGSNPTARAVTGVVANAALSGQIPFAKPNGANLPVSNGVPTDNNNNGILNNNNVPLLVGLGGTTSNILQNNGNNMLNGLPVANGGQLPSGSSLQMLMFGTLTVMDNELTEGHELGSGLLGKAQGFYVASAIDGTSQTMAFTAMFESGGYEDSISFFGVHRTAASESHLGVMGGTGKYVNARGYAIVKTFTGSSGTQQQQPHQFTDGLETVLECTVYLSY